MTMIKLTDQEKRMYDVMGTIAKSNVPVVYKGALITKLILSENYFNDFVRETQDIDASWVGASPPPMETLTSMLNHALSEFGLIAVAIREHGVKMSACYDIVEQASSELVMTIDIDMRAAVDSRIYHFGNVTFQGVTPDNVIADKISVIASDKVFRRSKDLIDLYALTNCVIVKNVDIHSIWERENRIIGTFDAFTNRKDELRHSYEKLRRIDVKPEFDVLYCYLASFLLPFIETNASMLSWDSKTSSWTNDASRTHAFI